MYKCVWLIRFRPDLDPAQVRERWRTTHGELALRVPGIRRYVQNHWVAETEGFARGWDGSVDVWFDDREAFEAALASPEWQALLEDDALLFDRSGDPRFAGGVVEEYVMRWDASPDRRPYRASAP